MARNDYGQDHLGLSFTQPSWTLGGYSATLSGEMIRRGAPGGHVTHPEGVPAAGSHHKRGLSWGRRGVRWAVAGGVTALTLGPTVGAAIADPGNGNGGPPVSVIVEYGQSATDAANLVSSALPPGIAQKSLDPLN